MDVPLAHQNIGIRYGLQGFKRKSSTSCHKAAVVGLFELFTIDKLNTVNGKPNFSGSLLTEKEDLSTNYWKQHY